MFRVAEMPPKMLINTLRYGSVILKGMSSFSPSSQSGKLSRWVLKRERRKWKMLSSWQKLTLPSWIIIRKWMSKLWKRAEPPVLENYLKKIMMKNIRKSLMISLRKRLMLKSRNKFMNWSEESITKDNSLLEDLKGRIFQL